MQRLLIDIIRDSTEPRTFADILGESGSAAEKRSCRRALKRLVDGNIILALGGGGPGAPHRYWLNPLYYLESTPPQIDRFEAGITPLANYHSILHAVSHAAKHLATERGWQILETEGGWHLAAAGDDRPLQTEFYFRE
jgi:hypothetical protein